MAPNLLEQLADVEVPPPPAAFDSQLHDKVNRSLLISQIIDLFASALPWAIVHFSQAFAGLVIFSVTGHYPPKSNKRSR
jgi:hypothetical protein